MHDDELPDSMLNSSAMRWVYRTIPAVSCLIVAAASFALSFVAISEMAVNTDAVSHNMAWLVPIVIDGGILCGSAVIWAAAAQRMPRPWFAFFVVFVLVVISVIVNAAHAGPTLLAKVMAALPPVVLLATLELVAVSTRALPRRPVGAAPEVGAQLARTVRTAGEAAPVPAPAPVAPPSTDAAAPSAPPKKRAAKKSAAKRRSTKQSGSGRSTAPQRNSSSNGSGTSSAASANGSIPTETNGDHGANGTEPSDGQLERELAALVADPELADVSSRRQTRVRALGPDV